jgi:hypothetical protein
MSKHWPPNSTVRPDARRATQNGSRNPWLPVALLAGAALAGAVVGAAESLLNRSAISPADPPIASDAPTIRR